MLSDIFNSDGFLEKLITMNTFANREGGFAVVANSQDYQISDIIPGQKDYIIFDWEKLAPPTYHPLVHAHTHANDSLIMPSSEDFFTADKLHQWNPKMVNLMTRHQGERNRWHYLVYQGQGEDVSDLNDDFYVEANQQEVVGAMQEAGYKCELLSLSTWRKFSKAELRKLEIFE